MAAWDEAPSPDSPEGRAVLSGTAPKTAQQIWDEAPTISGPKTAEGFWQNVQAAIEGTGTSMLLTQKLPEFQPSDPKTTPWYIRVPSQLAGLAADAPAMAIGAVAGLGGGPAAPVMAGAGMMAAPAVLREAMADYLQGKDVNLWELIKTGAKEGAIGGLTFGVGAKLRGVMPGASELMTSAAQNTGRTAYLTARGAAIAGAEAATMTGSRGVLEWRIPDAHEWIDSALVIGAMHGVNHVVPRVVSKLQDTWSKTGVPPERIAEDAAVNPEIRHDLMDEFRPIPRAYEHLIEPKAPPVVEEPPRVPADPALVTRIQETNKAVEDAVKALPKEEGTARGERVEITIIGGKVSGDATVAEVRAAQDKAEGKPPEKPQPLLEAEKAVDPADVVIPEPALKDLPTDGKIPIENTGGKNLNVSSVKNAEEAMRELQRHVEENQKTFKEAKGDPVAEAETVKAAAEWLNNVYGRDGIADKAGVEVSSAELVGRKTLMVQSATALSNFGREIHAQRAKGVPITVEQQARYLELKADLDVKASLFTKQSAEAGRILRALQIKIEDADRAMAVAKAVAKHEGRSPEEVAVADSAKQVREGELGVKAREEAIESIEKGTTKEDAQAVRTVSVEAREIAKKARKGADAKKLTEEQLVAKEKALADAKEAAEIKARLDALKKARAEEKRLSELRDKLEKADPQGRQDILLAELERTKAVEKAFKVREKETETQQVLDDVAASVKDLLRSINENVSRAEKEAAMRRVIDKHGMTEVLATFNKLQGQWSRGRPDAKDAADVAAIRKLTAEQEKLSALQERLRTASEGDRKAILSEYAMSLESLVKGIKDPGKITARNDVVQSLKTEVAKIKAALKENVTKEETEGAVRSAIEGHGLAKVVETFNSLYADLAKVTPDAADVAAIRRLTKERDQFKDLKERLEGAAPENRASILEEYAKSREGLVKNITNPGKLNQSGEVVSILKQEISELKHALRENVTKAERDRAILTEVERQGGAKTLESFLTILATVGDTATVVKVMKPATMLGKTLEFWKAGLISGPWTWGINLAANVTQTAFRVPISVAKAALGTMRKGEDRVLFAELVGEAYGMARGGLDGIIAAGKLLRHLDESVTANMSVGEGHAIAPQIGKGYIPGIHLGSVVRYPFRLLTAGDLIFKGMHESATAHAMAYRRAIEREGAHDNIHEAAQKYLKDPDILAAAEASGKKYTFTTELAPFGKAMAGVLREAPVLQFVLPFWRTPANIFKESAMFVPGVNLLMREQRAAVRKGGEAADQVYAQMIVGGAVMGAVWALVDARYITGGGDPDPKARATQTAAGMVPYSIMGKDVSQLGSFGTILSLAADLNIMSQYMTAGEMEHAGRMLGFAMTQQVMNKTSLQGLAKFFAAMAQPYQKFDKFWEQLVASFVPGIVSQVAGGSDDYIREVHSFADAIRNRIPGLRNGLFPKNDLFGEPIPTFDHLWGVLPIKSRLLTNDPVRLEAARLGILTPDIEEQVDAVPGKLVGKVKLTPQQMDTFSAGSGKMAYEYMKELMLGANGQITPEWEGLPDQVKKQMFNKAFEVSRRAVKAQVLEPNTEAAAEKAYADFFKEIRNKTFNVRVPGKEKQ